jgi:hypothetical protein
VGAFLKKEQARDSSNAMGAFEMRKRVSSRANSSWSRDEVAKKSQPLAHPETDLTAPQANQIGIRPRTMADNRHCEKSFSRLRRLKLQFNNNNEQATVEASRDIAAGRNL